MAGDRERLKRELARVLGWDAMVTEGVVDALATADSQAEVDSIVANFMDNHAEARRLVAAFRGASSSAVLQPPMPGMVPYKKGEGLLQTGAAAAPPRAAPAGRALQTMELQPAAAAAAAAAAGKAKERPAVTASPSKPPIDLGINVRTTVAKPRKAKGAAAGGPSGPGAALDRKVVNCLSCGKVYDCRAVSNDIIAFVDAGGVCTFCGALVALRYADGSTNQHLAQVNAGGAAAAGASSSAAEPVAADPEGGTELAGFKPESEQANAAGAVAYNASEAAARALKDRLVEYDRHAAKRTTVIDDQSDYFEIDTNAWLTDEERAQLRQRQRELEEAEEARRRRLVVSIDLLGRQVIMDAGGAAPAAAGDTTDVAPAAASAAAAEAARAAAEATLQEAPQGGGAGAAAALERARQALEDLRIKVNPSLADSRFVFLPKQQRQQDGGMATPAGAEQQRRRQRGGRRGRAAAPCQQRSGVSRLQHDDPFDDPAFGEAFGDGIEVLADSEEARLALEAALDAAASGPFDICVGAPAPPSVDPAAVAEAILARAPPPSSVEVLQEGLVLLRGWLSLGQQVDLVNLVRSLGLGPGGFYVPSYSDGRQLGLHMMCLGLHWEPRTAAYESTRSSYDGATPPPLPPPLAALAARCAEEAAAALGAGRLPTLSPDVCLCNFYEKKGRLGLHQDKDEGHGSLRSGLPVVSLSMGDDGDFVFGPSRDESRCRTIRLTSGDALVFGGNSRMLYHGVAAVHSGTAPPELLRATGLRPGRLNMTFRQT